MVVVSMPAIGAWGRVQYVRKFWAFLTHPFIELTQYAKPMTHPHQKSTKLRTFPLKTVAW